MPVSSFIASDVRRRDGEGSDVNGGSVRNNRAPKVRSGIEIVTGNLNQSRSRRINGDAVARQACLGILMVQERVSVAQRPPARSKADVTKGVDEAVRKKKLRGKLCRKTRPSFSRTSPSTSEPSVPFLRLSFCPLLKLMSNLRHGYKSSLSYCNKV